MSEGIGADGDIERALSTLADPTDSANWVEPHQLRRAATQRHQRRTGLLVALSAVCVVAVVVPFANRGSRTPTYHGPLTVTARQGAALQLMAPRAAIPRAKTVNIATSEQAFTIGLMRHLLPDDRANLVVSPSSLAIALSMLSLGARGQTERQITALLGPSGSSAESVAAGWTTLMADWVTAAAQAKIQLASANSLWVQHGLVMKPDFMQQLASYFRSGVWQVDFANDPAAAAKSLNAWVKTNTQGQIPSIVTADDVKGLALILANATYFQAKWAQPFEPGTEPAAFTTADGSTLPVPTIRGEVSVQAAANDQYEAVQIPYVGGRFAALVIEPHGTSLSHFVAGLTGASLNNLVQGLRSDNTSVAMPALHLNYDGHDLIPILEALGVRDVFSDGADLSGLSPTSLKVTLIRQKATLGVSDTGTVAAAATIIGAVPTAARRGPDIAIDHPYLFLIRDTVSGAILFSAAVENPS